MTPEEAIEILEEVKELDDTLYAYNAAYMEALEVALFALKEIQNYRKLGTLEELARAKKYIDLAKKHGTIGEMIDECAEYESIGTVEECREAVEKQKAKKPKEILRHRGGFEMQHCPKCDTDYQVDRRYKIKDGYCPACGKLLDSAFRNYCANCGQAIDENLEGMEDD